MEKIGTFEVSPGNKSSSRITAFISIMTSLAFSLIIILVGCYIAILNKEVSALIAAAGAAGTQFAVIAGGAMLFMYNQKKQENGSNT